MYLTIFKGGSPQEHGFVGSSQTRDPLIVMFRWVLISRGPPRNCIFFWNFVAARGSSEYKIKGGAFVQVCIFNQRLFQINGCMHAKYPTSAYCRDSKVRHKPLYSCHLWLLISSFAFLMMMVHFWLLAWPGWLAGGLGWLAGVTARWGERILPGYLTSGLFSPKSFISENSESELFSCFFSPLD